MEGMSSVGLLQEVLLTSGDNDAIDAFRRVGVAMPS
jgi:hypothetical protein